MAKVDDIFSNNNNNGWFIPGVSDSAVARTRGMQIANVSHHFWYPAIKLWRPA